MSKDWIEKAKRDRSVVNEAFRYWIDELKNSPFTDEEDILFLIMHTMQLTKNALTENADAKGER